MLGETAKEGERLLGFCKGGEKGVGEDCKGGGEGVGGEFAKEGKKVLRRGGTL